MSEAYRQQIYDILKKNWGFSSFRPGQEDIILSVLSGRDTIALLPTGGGKSICFQVPALCREGLCLVVSPLIALMKDQVENLEKKGIRASLIHSGLSYRESDTILENCIYGNTKFLYVSPERLKDALFRERLKSMKINLVAIDEAHCISQWGYDFRPSYLEISEIKKIHPGVCFIALTASATQEVVDDIAIRLEMKDHQVFRNSFVRKNLSYSVLEEENKKERIARMIRKVGGSAIVYAKNRRTTAEISRFLNLQGIVSGFYHAGLNSKDRNERQEAWTKGKTPVIVATNAFGMGIDKADVKLVIHHDFPDNPEAYYQEAGRAGRNGEKSYAVILYNQADIHEQSELLRLSFPEIEEIRRVYQALANFYQIAFGSGEGLSYPFDINLFSQTYSLNPLKALSSLKILVQEGLISFTDSVFEPSKIKITTENEVLYNHMVTTPQDEPLIKTILRMYEGLFRDYKKVNEWDIARKSRMDKEKVIAALYRLTKTGLIDYIEASEDARICFLTPRMDAQKLRIDEKTQAWRKMRAETRFESMRTYLINKEQCRTAFLVSYFGEEAKPCGICDICLRQNESGRHADRAMNLLSMMIKEKKRMDLAEIFHTLAEFEEDQALDALRKLLDNGLIAQESPASDTYILK